MEITDNFNQSTKEYCVVVKSELLRQYYNYFIGLFNIGKRKCKNKKIFEGVKVVRESNNSVKLIIPTQCPSNSIFNIFSGALPPIFEDMKDNNVILIDKETRDAVDELIRTFLELTSMNKNNTTEFIPLEGYDVVELQNEIDNAVKNKRNLFLIDTFDNFLKEGKKELDKRVYNQFPLEFGTDEYVNAALLIKEGNLQKLKDLYQDKLTVTPWV